MVQFPRHDRLTTNPTTRIFRKFKVHWAPSVREMLGTGGRRVPLVAGIQAQPHLLAQRGHILGVVIQLALRQGGPRMRLIVCFSSISASKILTTIYSGFGHRPTRERPRFVDLFFSLPCFTFFLTSLLKSYPSSQQTSRHGSADGEGDKSPSIWPCLWLR